jgi:SNF2 family DNA or RNA helicase
VAIKVPAVVGVGNRSLDSILKPHQKIGKAFLLDILHRKRSPSSTGSTEPEEESGQTNDTEAIVTRPQGGILADFMGLGKSLQVIASLMTLLSDTKGTQEDGTEVKEQILTLCPTICIQNLEAESKKWCKEAELAAYPIFTLSASTLGENQGEVGTERCM